MRGLGALALRCVGLLVMVGTLRLVEIALWMSVGDESAPRAVALLAWGTALAQLLLGLWLMLRGGRLAARWFEDAPVSVSSAPRLLLRLAVLVVGVVFVALAIPGLCGALGSGIIVSSSGGDTYETVTDLSWDWKMALVSALYPLAQLVVGVLLIVLSERLSRRLWREPVPAPTERDPLPDATPPPTAAPDEA
jgi:hypothetical protein